MKQNKGPLIFLTIFTIFLFKENVVIHDTIILSCELFLTKVFPALFPMMILSNLFIYFGLPELLCQYLGKGFQKLFHTSPYGAFAFFISSFSGSPANAYTIKNLEQQGYLNNEEASFVLSFSFFNNPLFLYTMLSLIFPNKPLVVIKLILLPYVINLTLGFLTRKKEPNEGKKILSTPEKNFGSFLSTSIKETMNTLLFVLGTISIFMLLNALINPQKIPIIAGILEISQGLNSLININLTSKIKEILAILFISFGGLSIHLQIKGIISDTKISYQKFLKMRILQTLISCLIIFVI